MTSRALRVAIVGVIVRELRRIERAGGVTCRARAGGVVGRYRRNTGIAALCFIVCGFGGRAFFACFGWLMTGHALRVGVILRLVRRRNLRETCRARIVTTETFRASGDFVRDARRFASLGIVTFGRNGRNVT